jgi:hypothetical protein
VNMRHVCNHVHWLEIDTDCIIACHAVASQLCTLYAQLMTPMLTGVLLLLRRAGADGDAELRPPRGGRRSGR